ncbi:MAG: ABC-2 family transporter protein [Ilumatobacteraceae bacterium]
MAIVAGVGVFAAIWITGAASTFWTIDTMEITNSFTYGGRQLTSYPMTIYSSWLRRLVTYAVPLAVVGYYPVRGVLEREPAGTPVWVRFVGVPAAVVAGAAALAVWNSAVRNYRGVGS